MSEHLVVDSLMTADGEVVQLPTLGPLGPVDAQGGRIPLDTVKLFDACGGTLCQARALHSICHRIHSLLAGDGK